MRSDLRAAAIGGLAATLVVAASLAPKLTSHPTEQAFHQTAAEETTTTTVEPAPTTTTTTVVPTTIAEPAVTERVGKVEERVTVLEQAVPTTTTTVPLVLTAPLLTGAGGYVTWPQVGDPSVRYLVSWNGQPPMAMPCCGPLLGVGTVEVWARAGTVDGPHATLDVPGPTTTTTVAPQPLDLTPPTNVE